MKQKWSLGAEATPVDQLQEKATLLHSGGAAYYAVFGLVFQFDSAKKQKQNFRIKSKTPHILKELENNKTVICCLEHFMVYFDWGCLTTLQIF